VRAPRFARWAQRVEERQEGLLALSSEETMEGTEFVGTARYLDGLTLSRVELSFRDRVSADFPRCGADALLTNGTTYRTTLRTQILPSRP
jgi:hypothetical protein